MFIAPKTPSLGEVFRELADIFQPPERLSVSEAAAKYRYLNNPGAYIGPWLNETAPYMVEPMDTIASRQKSGIVFTGPAQCAKTDALLLNGLAYTIKVDPMDAILYCPTMAAAKDFSVRRIDRLHRNSPEIGANLLPARDADNKFDKHYKTGIMLTISWPSISEFAGRPIGRVWLTDYDRMPDDIDGEGAPYDLASKRTTTYGSFAMTLAESSPSRPVTNPTWIRSSPHEAPPTTGILGLYNRGDRRMWYWPCPKCRRFFSPEFKHLEWDDRSSHAESADTARMVCPACAFKISFDARHGMQQEGRWVQDGQVINENGVTQGLPVRSNIASFWLDGTAAAFTSWSTLVTTYLDANKDFERSGSEEALKKFWNTDLGRPYLPKNTSTGRLPEVLKSRAEPIEEKTVPADTRFLVAAVDVQKNAFVVQVHGICPGEPFDMVLVDRFTIFKPSRPVDEHQWPTVKPGTYLEDWEEITSQVIEATYPLDDDSGRRMAVKLTVCDSGGREGVTANAYAYFRKLRQRGLHTRFHLVKGDHLPNKPRAYVDHPDARQKGKQAIARGDVPVLFLNSLILKDALANRLDATVPGTGMLRIPDWVPDYVYSELCSEFKDEKGRWINPPHARNEAWDLAYYTIGACVSPLLRVEGIDWSKPPLWAAPWETNALVFGQNSNRPFANPPPVGVDLGRLAAALA